MSALPPAPRPDGLGPLLLRTRHAHGRSQQRLAEQLCAVAGVDTVSRHEISRWEREERLPSRYWLGWLSVVLGIGMSELERASARTRARRASARTPSGAGASASRWPWRILAASRDHEAAGRGVIRVPRPHPAGRPDQPVPAVVPAASAGDRGRAAATPGPAAPLAFPELRPAANTP
jgi:transcriptional regulator with XRE-family HTH domain